MIWIIIIVIVVFVIGKFIFDKNKVNARVKRQGGMMQKYKTLVEHFKGQTPDVKILKLTSDTIDIGLNGPSGNTVFSIVQSFDYVVVKWKMKSIVFGKHSLEWRFNHLKDQSEMAKTIYGELETYQNNVLEKNNTQ